MLFRATPSICPFCMAEAAKWWGGVDEALMENITGQIHPGAVRYYEEAGFTLTDDQK